MKIAVSADCFTSFTSGFPVRGIMLNLIKKRPYDTFLLYYTKRLTPPLLQNFYEEINGLPNVEVRYFKYGRRAVALRRLLKLPLIDQCDFDLFINPGNPEVWPNITVPSICSIADFSTLKGLSTGKYAWFYKYYNRWYLRYAFKRISVIVPISHFTEKDLFSFWPEFNGKTQVIHNGIDDMWFDDHLEMPNNIPYKEKDYFIWWGLVSRRKNVEGLITAYKLAKEEEPTLPNLLIVGKIADYMEGITSLFNQHVTNIPFQDNYKLKYLVRNSAGLIFPSFYEGFGLPVIEAFSQGVKVACSNVTSLPEVADGMAILFDPTDTEDIKNAILKMWRTLQAPMTLIEYAKHFMYENAASKYSQIIDIFK